MEATKERAATSFPPADDFARRHIGPSEADRKAMLAALGRPTLDALIDAAVPASIRLKKAPVLPAPSSEVEALAELRKLANRNQVWRSYLGQGYSDTVTPPVILREILENAGWYTAYTPYQPEIAQGRLEALLNFQTVVIDLTGLPVANASLLDEGTAAAEAMALCLHASEDPAGRVFFVDENCHPQTLAVVRTRAEPLGVEVLVGDPSAIARRKLLGALVQYPDTRGAVKDWSRFAAHVHEAGGLLVVAADPLALTLFKAPGAFGADIAIGSTQRFGVPMGFGGPHAAYMAVAERFARRLPGRIVGVSKDSRGKPALRLALQTREQHIRREKATSNICTAQVLLAVIAGMYAVYHGPEGLTRIAARVRAMALALRAALKAAGFDTGAEELFDTVSAQVTDAQSAKILAAAKARRMNLRFEKGRVIVALDETTTEADLRDLLEIFGVSPALPADAPISASLARDTPFLTHKVFSSHRSESEMLRYLRSLGRQGPRARPHDDPAGLLHHEAQRGRRDAARDLAGVRPHAPVRARRTRRRAITRWPTSSPPWLCRHHAASPRSRCSPTPARRANTRACSPSAATTQSRGAGASQDLPHPGLRARHQPRHGVSMVGMNSGDRRVRCPTATSTWPTSRPRPMSTRTDLCLP